MKRLIISFKRFALLSAMIVMMSIALVYGIRQFAPNSRLQKLQSNGSQASVLPILPYAAAPSYSAQLVIFDYSGDAGGLIQAPVIVTGPENLNGTTTPTGVSVSINWVNGTPTNETETPIVIAEESYNGTTTTDPQNPLKFTVFPGVYSVFGTYASAAAQNETVTLASGDYAEVILNFGYSPAPTLTFISIIAFYTPTSNSSTIVECSNLVQASITITGPQFSYNATTSTAWDNPLILTVIPGDYFISATYDSVTQYSTVNVTSTGGTAWFNFGSSSWLPPP